MGADWIRFSATIATIITMVMLALFGGAKAAEIEGRANASCKEIKVFVTTTCPHCNAAREYLQNLKKTQLELELKIIEVDKTAQARRSFEQFNFTNEINQPGVPTFSVCGEVIVGFDEFRVSSAIFRRDKDENNTSIDIPVFGNISVTDLGLPAFTIVLGLIDGFNPCAMWVLLFLLSILVHVKKRSRILLIASTFVLVSGIVYFAFMAAWLNMFFIIGHSRVIHLLIGSIAIAIGAIHIKDFFAYRFGISLSIPQAAKPGIYRRVRGIVNSENIFFAITGVVILAILVNFLELICTAGLPALYTQILSQHELQKIHYYAYLALYNLAYIVDDGIMVAIAVVTLGQKKLQETEGRWLKLLSGLIVSLLGIVLVIAPHWLTF